MSSIYGYVATRCRDASLLIQKTLLLPLCITNAVKCLTFELVL